jgi:transcriptional regulator with XRE-family HTH domain
MRAIERKKARRLRARGLSLREIAERIHCAKSSISDWVHDIPLTPEQIDRLELKQDKARARAANHPNSPKQKWARIRQDLINSGAKEISAKYSFAILKLIGAALYWAEGYKASVNMISFSNSDPSMIALMMRFFRVVCKVPENKFRGIVHIYPHLSKGKAEKFWSGISGIPVRQFHKTQFSISRASKHKRDTLPLGTFGIVICDTRLFSRITGWIKGIERWGGLRALGSVG